MIIREAVHEDAYAISLLHAESWCSAYRGILSDEYLHSRVHEERRELWDKRLSDSLEDEHIILVEENAEILGFICVVGNADPTWGVLIDNLHVRPHRKGQGIGRILMCEAATWAMKNYPGDGLFLGVLQENVSALRFYEHLGASIHPSPPWNAPDGQEIPEFLCVWQNPSVLLV